ncbi:RelA/SpoT family protein [Pelolinea submarina]|uniref:GTP pyrophosphokinase n=1 Tax=Pelolinea submarina TaxID=913107 RepID=A0A347ZTJ3_9CHLR|nr:bifunctional (p)ppGpp synthetase/guanosine-3',5'-bis(diphosphate) 3'-pyrophosphohydrolase [Pelolinea submarina]REG10801.1 GTP pyrophosphokinase [Pelolinea submarina]BBB48624.1 GTP pyrophosphokinase [Pelolinea submarina]
MTFEDLLKILPENYSVVDRELIKNAYTLAEEAHRGQLRASGEPYITHCVAVAYILAELKVPPVIIAAALLHDTVEDTSVTLDDLKNKFGDEIASLVDGVTKLTNLPRVSRGGKREDEGKLPSGVHSEEDQLIMGEALEKSRKKDLATETLRKTLMAMGDDVRVVMIKLADRLHNMRTLSYIPESKRYRIAKETMDIFAPLANRLGIWQIKWELEDLAFRYTQPEEYKAIAEKLSDRRVNREAEVNKIIAELEKVLSEGGIKAEISGRPKHIYSIYQKMVQKDKSFEMVRDLRGVRLIVQDIPSCYAALGIIHTHWRPIPNEFDDYIAAPKDNFYQSIHTSVIYNDGKPLEVQIRTEAMHHSAEYGIAAHWLYKEKGNQDDHYQQRVTWLRKLMEWRQDVDDAQEFVDGVKSDVFEDRAYVFTPRGDIIDLPIGSTPIDFAYAVHTEVGNRCRGAKINGKLVPLDYKLKTGDQVEILTAKRGGPSRDWLNMHLGLVNTQRARAKIRQWFKKQDREQNLSQGREILDKELKRLGIVDLDIDDLGKYFEYKGSEDLYVALGCGDLAIGKIINHIQEVEKENSDPLFTVSPVAVERKDSESVNVLGLKGILTSFAKCCNPAPGDEIVGYITRGRGATIHRNDCPNILRMKDRERLVKVSWGEAKRTFPVSIMIKAYDRQGLMGDISTVLGNEGINMRDIHITISNNLATINLLLDIGDISQLSRVLTLMESLPNVMEAFRVKPG